MELSRVNSRIRVCQSTNSGNLANVVISIHKNWLTILCQAWVLQTFFSVLLWHDIQPKLFRSVKVVAGAILICNFFGNASFGKSCFCPLIHILAGIKCWVCRAWQGPQKDDKSFERITKQVKFVGLNNCRQQILTTYSKFSIWVFFFSTTGFHNNSTCNNNNNKNNYTWSILMYSWID